MEANVPWYAVAPAAVMQDLPVLIDAVNFILPGGRWHLFEFCDLSLYAL